ncbi:glycosyltransferase family 2 protein [Candidatus Woesearchaeota archaeon]|nr:glycosyltransferase family 2 protein [Candidatus Woesearchaeota archaeon]
MDYVIIPAYNEGKNIGQVLTKTVKYIPSTHIIVVDDGSKDHTSQEAQKHDVITLRHNVNLGKGAALKTGCDYALTKGATRIVVMDADGQHDPAHIPHFFELLDSHDIIFGKRIITKSMPFVFRFGNTFINQVLRVLYGIKVEDSQCGYRSFNANIYPKIRWRVTDYFMETEMIVNAGKAKLTHTQYPIETIYGDRYKGTTVIDGVKIVLKMIAWRIFR